MRYFENFSYTCENLTELTSSLDMLTRIEKYVCIFIFEIAKIMNLSIFSFVFETRRLFITLMLCSFVLDVFVCICDEMPFCFGLTEIRN